MPGPAHETLVALLQQRPSLLNEILRALGRPEVAAGLEARDSALRLVNPLEVRPDVVLLDAHERGPWVIVDVQLREDVEKQRRWLAAASVLLDTRGVMGDVLVITHDAAVARWANTIARVRGPAGTSLWLRPVVVRLTLAEVKALLAAGSAELAVVASWAVHDQTGHRAKAVVRAAVKTITAAPDTTLRQEMLRAMISMLGDTLAREIEDLLMTPLNIKDSPVYTRIVTALEARGEARGKALGEALGEARLLLRTLEKRGVAVDEATRARVTACTDTAVLDRWFDRALTATSLDEVFADAP
jgi:hypothetical protein